MIEPRQTAVSFPDLIEALEHIELDQLQSDIPANTRAELKHIKKNLSAILAFLGNLDASAEPGLKESIRVVRRECMSLHITVAKLLVLHFFRLNLVMDSQYATLVAAQYERVSEAMCQTCRLFSPQLVGELSGAL
jgi:hypothetical protein